MASNDSHSSSSSSTHTITLSTGDPVKIVAAPGVCDSDLRNAIDSTLFKQWLKNLQGETGLLAQGKVCLRQVQIQGVDMFGRGVGFLKFKADIFEKETGKKIPGIVFARGPAVAVLILLESGGETYVALTEQIRVPVGKSILELPAGMLDDERGDIAGTAVREVEEEIGITINVEDMVNLTEFLNPETGHRVFPSPGGCDEELSLFLYHASVKEEVIRALHGKEMGLRDHGELIKKTRKRGRRRSPNDNFGPTFRLPDHPEPNTSSSSSFNTFASAKPYLCLPSDCWLSLCFLLPARRKRFC